MALWDPILLACSLLLEISSGTHDDLPMTEFDGRPDLLLLLSRGVKILWIQPRILESFIL
jgi:hypothetical protein